MAYKAGIAVIEDHPLTRDALISHFMKSDKWRVMGAASNFDQAKSLLLSAQADVILLDLQLEDGLGLNIISWLKEQDFYKESFPLIAVYSAFDDFVHVSAALGFGAQVYINKRKNAYELEEALLKARKGEIVIDDTIRTKLDIAADFFSLLTKREAQILALVNNGLSNKQIAQRLGISARTVQNIIYCIYDKTGIRSRLELQKL